MRAAHRGRRGRASPRRRRSTGRYRESRAAPPGPPRGRHRARARACRRRWRVRAIPGSRRARRASRDRRTPPPRAPPGGETRHAARPPRWVAADRDARDPARDRPRGGDRDLLADDRADGDLEPVERAGHAKAGRPGDERAQPWIGGERRVDHRRIRVEVEEAARTPASTCSVTGASESSISTSIALPDAGRCADTTPMAPSIAATRR